MAHTPLDQHILDLLDQNGEMRARDIYDTRPETSRNTIRNRIGKLKTAGKVEKVQNGIYGAIETLSLWFPLLPH